MKMVSERIGNPVIFEQEWKEETGYAGLWVKGVLYSGNQCKDSAVEVSLVCSRNSKKYLG